MFEDFEQTEDEISEIMESILPAGADYEITVTSSKITIELSMNQRKQRIEINDSELSRHAVSNSALVLRKLDEAFKILRGD